MDDLRELLRRAGGAEVELFGVVPLRDAWEDYSGAMAAQWLVVNDSTFSNFVGWLVGERSRRLAP